MSDTTGSRRDREISAARAAARVTTLNLALAGGAPAITRPLFPGTTLTTREVDPIAGLRASHDLEQTARYLACDDVRQAREAGHSWNDIGTALHFTRDREPGRTVAEAAFDYAAGNPDSHYARTYGRSITWSCTSCDQAISDHGLANGPADDERGHAPGCQRPARTIRARDAEREAGQ
jgi:hypothetical protein